MRLRRTTLVCQEVVELITDYFDGVLPPKLAKAVDRHLAACPHCTAFVEQLRASIALAGAIEVDEVPDDVVDALAAAFDEYHREHPDPEAAD